MRRHDHSTDTDTELALIEQRGQYAVHEIKKLDGVIPSFDAYDLVIRGHTMLIVGEQDTGNDVTAFGLRFDSPTAVDDIGVDLLRSRFVMIPLDGITLLENVTNKSYVGDRRVENPLTQSMPFHESTVAIPHEPLQTA